MSPEYRGIFQLMKKETQPAIAREDWTTEQLIGVLLCADCDMFVKALTLPEITLPETVNIQSSMS